MALSYEISTHARVVVYSESTCRYQAHVQRGLETSAHQRERLSLSPSVLCPPQSNGAPEGERDTERNLGRAQVSISSLTFFTTSL